MQTMQCTVTDVAWPVCVCVSDRTVSPTKMAELTGVLFGGLELGVTKEPCIRARARISHGKEHFLRMILGQTCLS